MGAGGVLVPPDSYFPKVQAILKKYEILFIDDRNGYQSQMAAAIARKRFPQSGRYSSAGRKPVKKLDPQLLAFLEEHGIDTRELTTQSIDSIRHELPSYDLVVSLDRGVKKYFHELPFHTVGLRWKIAGSPDKLSDDEKKETFEKIYRELTMHVDDLMQTLVGDNAR